MISKQEIRINALLLRKSLSVEMYHRYSKQISEKAIKFINDINAKSVHVYITDKKRLEPDTEKIIEFCLNHKIDVYVPFLQNGIIKTTKLFEQKYVIGKFGLLEPEKIIEVSDTYNFDAIFVPTLSYDNDYNRIGSGKGMYDRFLKDHKIIHKIGLCFAFNHVNIIPTDENDIKLDVIINEKN